MLLFQKRFHQGLRDGAITLTFRRWASARVRIGGRYRCHPIGVLEVDDVRTVHVADIAEAEARAAGFSSRDALIDYLRTANDAPLTARTQVFRVALHHAGDEDRVALALDDALSPDDVLAIAAKLARLDAQRAWTQETLALIADRPQVAASQLAKQLRRETLPFKVDVRKLKKLGLTQSFEVGYALTPRGRAYLAATDTKRRGKTRTKTQNKTATHGDIKKTNASSSSRKTRPGT